MASGARPVRAADSLEAALDAELQRTTDYAARLEATRQRLERKRDDALAEVGSSEAGTAELRSRLALAETGSSQASELYDSAVKEVETARVRLRETLADLGRDSAVPRQGPQVAIEEISAPSVADRVALLGDLRRRAERDRDDLVEFERRTRWMLFEHWAAVVEHLNGLRLTAIDKLPPSRRDAVLGIGRVGIAQMRREAGQVELTLRTYLARTRHSIREAPAMLRDVFALGSATWTLTKILVVLVLYLWLRPRRERLRALADRWSKGAAARTRARMARAGAVAEVVAPWGGFLLLLVALSWAAGSLAERPEFRIVLRVAGFYAGYRLAIDVLFATSVGLARHYRLRLSSGRLAEILRTVRTLMRVLFAILVLRVVAEVLLGRGYLFFAVSRAMGLVFLATVFVLLRRWQPVIADTYLGKRGAGALARLVRRTRDRWYGVFVSAVAFSLLAASALGQMARDTAMGFEQTRRGLAFLFRRRVEKLAERAGRAEGDVSKLPPAVVAAFAEDPADEQALTTDHFPGHDVFAAMRQAWLAEDIGASFLLSGEKGMGKTTWLNCLDTGEVPYTRITLDGRIVTAPRLAAVLAEELQLEAGENVDLAQVRRALADGPKRVVAVDLAQNLFLAKVGGYDTFEAFAELVEATGERVFWICAMSEFARKHLFGVRPDLMVFRHHQTLAGWSEEELGELLRKRSLAAEIAVEYDDLIEERTYDASGRERLLETEAGYMRLLWDYSDGNPRSALHFWLRSLVPVDDKRFRVRLFRAPEAAELEALGPRTGFLLKAIVVHENLSLRELSVATRYPVPVCRMLISRLEDLDVLRRDRMRYRLTTRWHRAAVRFLRRGNLIS